VNSVVKYSSRRFFTPFRMTKIMSLISTERGITEKAVLIISITGRKKQNI